MALSVIEYSAKRRVKMWPRKCLWILVFINLQFVNFTSCDDGITLAFAIDDTRSMWNDIDQVKKQAKAIMNMVLHTKTSEVKDFVLVTINDPDVTLRTRTTSSENFLHYLNKIKVHNYGNNDCAERALAGIEKALEFSRAESYVYVFTDATTKELYKLNSITKLCQKKQSQVVFVLTGDCREPTSNKFTVYYDVARACSGQVFRVKKNEVHSVLKTIEILLKGKNSIFKWSNIPRSPIYVPVEFTLDEKAEYAIVSTSGKNVKLRITTSNNYGGSEPLSEKTMWNDNGKVVNLIKPKPGTYYAWVKGDSTVSVVVYGRTDFTFGYGFSVLEPKSMRDTVKQPIAGLKQHITINVTDPDHSVDIKSAQILDISNDRIIDDLPVKSIGDNLYITETFLFPNYTFKISVKGEIKKTHETIVRNSRNIDPQIVDLIPESKPVINIPEGTKLDVNYGSGVSLTCKVTAHPTPKIEWYSSSGRLLPSNSSVLEDPLFVSYLRLNDVKQSGSYFCKASNTRGPGTDVKIDVNVLSVFTPIVPVSKVKTAYNAKYGEDVKIPCNVKSYLPITIKWYRSGKELSRYSDTHSISSDGTELTLKSMDIKMQGKYTCEATLNSDPTVKQTLDIEASIPGLASPQIQSTNTKMDVMKGDKIELNCKITKGYPKPQTKWFKKEVTNGLTASYILLPETAEVLTIDNVLFKNSGQYKCEVTNPMGTDTNTFDVTVSNIPEITITMSTTNINVAYDGNAVFTYKVEAYPPPRIVWKDEKGSDLPSKTIKVSENLFIGLLNMQHMSVGGVYTLLASNSVGSANKNVNVNVLPAFEVNTHINENIEIRYGNKETLQCNIRSAKPMTIRWYTENVGVKSGRSAVSSSDKYTISDDGTKLIIKSMGIDTAGKYTCEASLLAIPTEKVSFSSEVKVVGISRPEIQPTNTRINLQKGGKVELYCSVTKGIPKPQLKWFKKDVASYILLPESAEVLTIDKVSFKNAGQYKCEVTNVIGRATKIFDVTIINLPEIAIAETKMEVSYDSKIVLKCKVEAYPEPSIVWKDEKGSVLTSEVTKISENIFISQLNLQNTRSGVFNCLASNSVGSTNEYVNVKVLPAFEVNPRINVKAVLNARYGEDLNIPCDVKSHLPFTIKWFRSGKEMSRHSDKHSISSDGTELTLKSMDIEMQGKYTCEATLNSDPTVKQSLDIEASIPGLAIPEILITDTKIDVMKGGKFELNCKFTKGYPKPQVRWFKKDVTSYVPLPETTEVLTIDKVLFKNAGQYKCEVTNQMGTDKKTFDVTISNVPEISITETKMEVSYDSDAVLTCKVVAYPPPSIVWKDEEGSVLPSGVTKISENVFIGQLNLINTRRSGVFICLARNSVGSTNENVKVKVLPAFEVNPHINVTEVLNAKYGEDLNIPCDVKSHLPFTIKWHRSGKELSRHSDKHSISSDGTELTLKSMDIEMQGKYTCEATLNSDPTVKQTLNIEASIPGLAVPEIQFTNTKIDVMKGGLFKLHCKFTKGYPKPQVKWFKKDVTSYVPLPETTEVLTIDKVLFKNAGQYKCEVTNQMGTDTKTFDVTISNVPEISVTETKMEVSYDSDAVLTCKVVAYPPPSIVWKDEEGSVLPSGVTKISENVFIGQLNLINTRRSGVFICLARNSVGSTNEYVNVKVLPAFEVNPHINVTEMLNAKYGEDLIIPCDVKSHLPITIKWFRSGKELSGQSDKHFISSDGSKLTLKSMDIEMQGKYTCEATLNSDPTVKQTLNIEASIPGLASPEILLTNTKIDVMKGGKIELNCKFTKGYPKPRVKWFKKDVTSSTLLPESAEALTIDKVSFKHAGQYKCEVSNPMGTDTKTFDVTMSNVPEISVTETKMEVSYDSDAVLTCKVVAYPPPSIVWKDEKGSVLPSEITKVSENVFIGQLNLPNTRRSGVFNCLASNSIGSTNEYVNVKVLPAFQINDVNINEKIEINYGNKKTLQCNITSAKPMTIRWYTEKVGIKSERSVVSSSDKYTVSDDGTTLIIKSMGIDTAGKYTCEATLLEIPTEKVSFSSEVTVVGLIAPEVTYSTTVFEGHNLTAICRVKAVPEPIISWQFKPKGSDEFSPIPGSGEELNIPQLRLKHTGVYKCIANNVIGKTERDLNVVVEERPIITNEELNQYGVEGDSVLKVPCNVTGFPEPTIVWKMGYVVLNTDSKYEIKGTTLYINKPVKLDSAEYTCEAKNKLGIATMTSNVEIVDAFEGDENYNGESYDIHVEQGKPKTIKCNLKNTGGAVRWYMDGVLIKKETKDTFTIEKASIANEKNYTCRVNTDEGSKSETYAVYIGYPPIFEENSPSPIAVDWSDAQQTLDCTSDAQPSATYKWTHNGMVIDSETNKKQIPITQWGQFSCQVSNVLGTISKIFDVTTSGCYITRNVAGQNLPFISPDMETSTWPIFVGNSDILLKEYEVITLSCPSNTKSANSFKMIKSKQEINATCITQDEFVVDGETYRYSELECSSKVKPSVLATGNQCSGVNTEMIRVGFEVKGLTETYKVCYDRKLNVPLYAGASAYLSRQGDAVDSSKFKWSSAVELRSGKMRLETQDWKREGSCKCCYTQGQLVNVDEMAFGPAQAATFKDNLNLVPIWNPTCDDEYSDRTSWKEFNDEIRAMALYNTWTGASEYRPTKEGLVPKFLWKVINYDEGSTVMVYVNEKKPVDADVRCSTPCESMMEADPFLYCCTLHEFCEKFNVPLEL